MSRIIPAPLNNVTTVNKRAGCRGTNEALEALYDSVLAIGKAKLGV